ncbi:RNA polymerase subunit sigma [Lysinibacillus sphaericus]|uniref:RNA polymerase subunit sigma n=1 Tax=Lysinibacillus sphaericus TaxID=1421 RepID=UPI0018CEE4F4|nr:RNA polymerase subunit sigma [Lysinibacillus sphaericus]MBG9755795.1 RNA polymerase sigma factor SigX [Lysinibacillus sphaericus]QTB14728.1 RNA polymerase subunit sigma [Lysinibacillus sphaericus]
MTHKPFDDEQLEHVLNNAPKLSDHRSKEDILNRLMADARLQDNIHLQEAMQEPIEDEPSQQEDPIIKKPATKSKVRNMQIFMSVAAVFVLTILVGTVWKNNQGEQKDQASMPETAQYSTMQEDSAAKEAATQDEMLDSKSIVAEHERILSLRTSVYEEDVKDAVVFRIGLAGRDAESVPMTYVIPNERVATDFGGEKPSTLRMYEKYAPQIDEEAKGFTEYHPYKGELKEKDDKLIHVLPKENDYDVASATVNEYKGTMEDTFSDSEYSEVEIQNEDGTPYEFSREGEPNQAMSLTNAKRYNYYLYQDTNGAEYLSPDFRQTFETVTEALTQMKNKNDDVYTSVVPENVTYTVKEQEEGVVVTFDIPLDLTSMEPIRATQLIEAMMLTAASFNQQLLLDNVVQESWEGFDLKGYLPKPVGPNKQFLP